MSAGLAEVLAEHVLGQYDNGGGDEWVEVRSVEELTAVVTEWLGERLREAREEVGSSRCGGADDDAMAEEVAASLGIAPQYHYPRDFAPGCEGCSGAEAANQAADAALAAVGKALGVSL